MHDKKWNASYLKYLKKVSKGVRRCNNLLPQSAITFFITKRDVVLIQKDYPCNIMVFPKSDCVKSIQDVIIGTVRKGIFICEVVLENWREYVPYTLTNFNVIPNSSGRAINLISNLEF